MISAWRSTWYLLIFYESFFLNTFWGDFLIFFRTILYESERPLPQFPLAPRCGLPGRSKLRVSVLQILGGQASQVGGRALGRPRALLQFAWGWEGRKNFSNWQLFSPTLHSYPDSLVEEAQRDLRWMSQRWFWQISWLVTKRGSFSDLLVTYGLA